MTRHQDLMDKALSCIHLARAINDRFPDPSKMPADEVQNRKTLLAEAARLQDLAEVEKSQGALEAWASAPDTDQRALATKAQTDALAAIQEGGQDRFAVASKDLSTKRFAKALRLGVSSLTLEEKAAIIEDSTGQIIVPHDLAGPIFLTLPRLGVLRPLVQTRNTTSNLVDVRALTGVTAGWGQLERGATPPTD